MTLAGAVKWSFLSEIAAKAITPMVFVILARLLTPEDYGLVAAATMVISFSQIFWEGGLGKALVQFQGNVSSAANAAFWINNALGIVVALALVACANVVADRIFHDHRVADVLRVMAFQVLLSAATSVHTALLQKGMEFKRLFWVRLVTVAVPALCAIPMAVSGFGYWALVAGTLLGQLVQVVMLWSTSTWRPVGSFDWNIAAKLGGFGAWVALSGLAAWFYLWADSLIVGVYLGSHDLGLYRTGNAFVTMVFSFLFSPFLPVLYSHLSNIQDDRARVERVLRRVIEVIAFLSLPLAFLLFAFSTPVSHMVFGPAWTGIDWVIAVLALTHGFAWIVGANGEAYRAVGRPDYETKVMLSVLPFFAIAYWISVQYGLIAFLWTRLSVALVGLCVHKWVSRIAVGVQLRKVLGHVALVVPVGAPLIIGKLVMPNDLQSEPAAVAVMAACAALWSIGYLWVIDRKGVIPELLASVQQALPVSLRRRPG